MKSRDTGVMTVESPIEREIASPPAARGVDAGVLEDELKSILPTLLASVAPQAFEEAAATLPETGDHLGGPTNWTPRVASLVGAFSAAMASAAGAALAARLTERLAGRIVVDTCFGPLEAAETAHEEPIFTTMTAFSNERSQLIRDEVIGLRRTIVISRHGHKVAAVIPLEPGSFEDAVYPVALQRAASRNRSTAVSEQDLKAILASEDPIAAARSAGVDTSGWDSLQAPADS
jgi:hypothetical protein